MSVKKEWTYDDGSDSTYGSVLCAGQREEAVERIMAVLDATDKVSDPDKSALHIPYYDE